MAADNKFFIPPQVSSSSSIFTIKATIVSITSLATARFTPSFTSEYISNICLKLFNSQTKQSLNTVRPGTAGELVRSLALPKLRQDQNFYKYKKTKTLKQTNKQTVINNNFLK